MFTKNKSKSGMDKINILLDSLEKHNIGDIQKNMDIRLDLQYGIPLSQLKRDYLKTMIIQLQELKQKTNPTTIDSESDNEIKDDKNIEKKKKSFSLFKKSKSKKDDSETKVENIEKKKKSFSLFKKSKSKKDDSETKVENKEEKKKSFSLFKKSKSKKDDSETKVENKEEKKKSFKNPFSKNIKIKPVNSDEPEKLEPEIRKHEINNVESSTNTQSSGQTKLELIEMEKEESSPDSNSDMEEFEFDRKIELEEIKQILDKVKKDSEKLSNDLDAIKSNYNYNTLSDRHKEINAELDSASSGLYSIQSTVYTRLKEIRKLKTDMANLEADIKETFYAKKD